MAVSALTQASSLRSRCKQNHALTKPSHWEWFVLVRVPGILPLRQSLQFVIGEFLVKTFVLAPALLVSLASVSAFAADELSPTVTPALGFQPAPAQATQDTQPTPAPSGAPGTAAPGSGSLSVSLPTSTTTTPPADKGAAEEKKPAKSWIDDFGGSSVFSQVSANGDVFYRASNPGIAPTVENFTVFAPRYTLSKAFQLRGRITLSAEFTDTFNTGTTTKREPLLGDTNLQLFYRGIPAILDKHVKFQPFVGVGLPTSKASRQQSLYFSPSVGVQSSYSNDKVLGGEFLGLFILTYARPVYASITPQNTEQFPYPRDCFGTDANSCITQGSGLANVRDALALTFLAVQEWGKWSPGIFYRSGHSFPFKFKEVRGASGELIGSSTQQGSPNVRTNGFFSFWLDYHANDWLTPEVGYQMFRPTFDADGKFGNPIFSGYQDWRVYLGANVQLDSLYKSLAGAGGESGVVRAKNNRGPIMFQ
jgi:hypothetical protein